MARFITQLRHGTTAEWELSNVVPAKNELVVEYCANGSKKFKLGDGVHRFTDLVYTDADIAQRIDELQNNIELGIPGYDSELPNNGLNELVDIRTDYAGDVHPSAGAAVRSLGDEVATLRSSLEQFVDAEAVDGLQYENNMLWLVADGNRVGNAVEIKAGSGDGGASYSTRLVNGLTKTTFTAATSGKTILKATFSETYDRVPTGVDGTLLVEYKYQNETSWRTYTTRSVSQDVMFEVDVSSVLKLSEPTSVKLTVTGGESGRSETLTYNITLVEASIEEVNFNQNTVYTGVLDFQYKCVGRNLAKKVFFEIDGEQYVPEGEDVQTSHNKVLNKKIDLTRYSHGSHDFKVYFVTPEGATSNVLRFMLLYNDRVSKDPIIGVVPVDETITYGNSLSVNYTVYSPDSEKTSDVYISVYAIAENGDRIEYESKHLDNVSRDLHTWSAYNYPTEGDVYIEFRSGSITKTVVVEVQELNGEVDLDAVTTGLVYDFIPVGKSNNDSDKGIYSYEFLDKQNQVITVDTELTGFNWVSNGYLDGESLRISGDSKLKVKLPIFTTSYVDEKTDRTVHLEDSDDTVLTQSGRTVEIELSISNVTDMTDVVAKCMSANQAGFKITPQNCYMLYAGGENVKLDHSGFIENESQIAAAYLKENSRMRVSFVIEPLASVKYEDKDKNNNVITVTSQCLNIYINGEFASSIPYSDTANFTAENTYLEIGTPSCITTVYNIKMYTRGLTADEIMTNFKCSPTSVIDKLSRFNDNDVLKDDGSGLIDYNKAIKKYPCLLVTGKLAAYKDAPSVVDESKTDCALTLTKPDSSSDGYTVEFELFDKDDNGYYVCRNNVQGTSSVKYPVKNYKVYLRSRSENPDGTFNKANKVGYSLKGYSDGNPLAIEESTLCWKGDYMSSDHANTFNANLADALFDKDTKAQEENPLVQNTIYGFRCLLFRRDTVDSEIEFAGDGALNNDKGNSKTFGLECSGDKGADTTRQKWEYKNSTDALCLFQSDKLFEPVNNTIHVVGNLESCYPDEGDLKDDGLTPNYYPMQALYTWVCQRANFLNASDETLVSPKTYNGVTYTTEKAFRKAIFVNEFEKHFNLHHALVYYLFNEFTALCDNRAKNMFLRCEDVRCEKLLNIDGEEMSIADAIDFSTGEVDADKIDWERSTFATWLTDLYDLDSCFGVENVGLLEIPYYAEWQYQLNNYYKFNGHESVFWLMFEDAFADKIREEAQRQTAKVEGLGLNFESLYKHHITDNALLVCPTVINVDMDYKYHTPWVEGFLNYAESTTNPPLQHISTYKYLQRGSRTYQKASFIERRCNMLYSKYLCSKFIGNDSCISFRPKESVDNAELRVRYNQDLYPAARFGDNGVQVATCGKVTAGSEAVLSCSVTGSESVGQNDTIYIGGGKLITDTGDLSIYHPMEVTLRNGISLRSLQVGSTADGYTNAATNSLDLSACKLLDRLNVANCTSLTQLDLSYNSLIKEVEATGCDANIRFPDGGVLTRVKLGSPTELNIMNHPNLVEFSCDYDKLIRLRVENTPTIPVAAILRDRLDHLTNGIRLIGITAEVDYEFLEMLLSDSIKGKYINASGNLIQDSTRYPQITGTLTYHGHLTADFYNRLKEVYPDLRIVYSSISAFVTFKLMDGSEVKQEVFGSNGVAGTARVTKNEDSITIWNTNNINETQGTTLFIPTLESSPEFDYTWAGWTTQENNHVALESDAIEGIDCDRVVYPAFATTTRSYTVRFWNENVLLDTVTTLYGDEAYYDGNTPEKNDSAHPEKFEFQGWFPDPGYIIGDLDCYAQFNVIDGKYEVVTASDIDYDVDLAQSEGKLAITNYKSNSKTVIKINEQLDGLANYTVTEIGGFANKDVEIVEFPSTVTKFRNSAFRQCRELEEVTIGKNVTTLEHECFAYCTNLKNITYTAVNAKVSDPSVTTPNPFNYSYSAQGAALVIDKDVESIPERLFYQSSALSESSGRVIDTITWDSSSVCTRIGQYAFYNANPKVVTFPESLTFIGANAFVTNDSMTELILPPKLTTIQSIAFGSWSKLETIKIPASVTVIDEGVFANCGSLSEIQVDVKNDKFHVVNGCLISSSGKLLRATNTAVIPNSGVSQIGENCFSGLNHIKVINFPEGISELPGYVASSCASLTTVTLPDSLTTIRTQAFMNSSKLSNIALPEGLKDIYSNAFANTAITEIRIPSSITDFHSGFTFKDCKHLTTVTFAGIANITRYGEKMFQGCDSLTDIYWPGTKAEADSQGLWSFTSVDTSKVTIHYADEVNNV